MKNLIISLGTVLFLAGCAELSGLAGKAATDAAKAKDIEARILIDSAGAVGLRAWSRLQSPTEKCGLLLLSGIPCNLAPFSKNTPVPSVSINPKLTPSSTITVP